MIGGPGTGKSTFSKQLGAMLDLPAYALDDEAFAGPEFAQRSPADRRNRARVIADQDDWICEGVFVEWTRVLADRADLIIWLDHLTWFAAARRIIMRFVSLALREVLLQRGLRKVNRFEDYSRHWRQLWYVLRTSRHFWWPSKVGPEYPSSRRAISAFLAPYEHKTLRCRTAADLAAVRTRAQAHTGRLAT